VVTVNFLAQSSARFIQVEPRHVEHDAVVRLDIFVVSEDLSVEVKAKPIDADVKHFVKVARLALEKNVRRRVRILSGAISCPRLRSLEQLIRVAKESAGQNIGWDRNSAFCQKCRGRLRRIEAERTAHKTKRQARLDESVELLKDAVKLFCDNKKEFGPGHPEVGDCYSLLGRTFLAADDLGKAERAAQRAVDLITDQNSKDFLDLQILLGDIEVRKLKFKDAMKHYDSAIHLAGEDSAERSEICARAWLHKALCLYRLRDNEWKNSHDRAEAIWQLLDEDYMAAHAQWTRLKLEDRVPEKRVRRLDAESPLVAVRFIHQWEAKRKSAAKLGAVAARDDIPDKMFKELLAQAVHDVEVLHRDW
jgi:tetratricopeptide (TPR) repeat protein